MVFLLHPPELTKTKEFARKSKKLPESKSKQQQRLTLSEMENQGAIRQ